MRDDLVRGRVDYLVSPAHLVLPNPQVVLLEDSYHVHRGPGGIPSYKGRTS